MIEEDVGDSLWLHKEIARMLNVNAAVTAENAVISILLSINFGNDILEFFILSRFLEFTEILQSIPDVIMIQHKTKRAKFTELKMYSK